MFEPPLFAGEFHEISMSPAGRVFELIQIKFVTDVDT